MDILLLAQPQFTANPPSDPDEAAGDGSAAQELQDSLQALRRALQAVMLVSKCTDLLPTRPICPTAAVWPALLRCFADGLDLLPLLPHRAPQASRSASKEARQWLFSSIAALELTDPATKRSRFDQFLPGGPSCRGKEHEPLALGLLQLLAEAAPGEVGAAAAPAQRVAGMPGALRGCTLQGVRRCSRQAGQRPPLRPRNCPPLPACLA